MSVAITERVLDQADARRLTERIRIAAVNYSEAKGKLLRLVAEAKEGSAHVALGYASWTAYLADVMSDEPLRLARDERREVVQLLSEEGMSTRAIAPIVGAHHDTVASDRKATVGNPTDGEPRRVESLDGKTRTYSAPSASSPDAPKPKPARKAKAGDMAVNFEQAIFGMKLTLSMGDPHKDLTEHQRNLITEELDHIINRVKGAAS